MALLDYEGPSGSTIDKYELGMPARTYRIIGGGAADVSIRFKAEDDTGMRAEHGLLAILAERVREKMIDDTSGRQEGLDAITKINSAMILLERYLTAVNE
jgi:hypothetical protein